MAITFTPEQQQVIDLHHKNILVSAAAGSGKTAVLTERIVKMISDEENPVDIDRLLVVTFTNAAAAEMRERISLAIAARLEEEPDNEHLQKQATLIHNAQITTIDSFCMFVIRNNFNDIGLDPGFRVADEGELKLLKQDVMQNLLEKKYAEKEESFLNCMEYFGSGNQDKAVENYILKLYQFAESNPWPEEWLTERKEDYQIGSVEELEAAPFTVFGMGQIGKGLKDCLCRLQECITICQQPDGPYMYGEVLEREILRLEKLTRINRYGEGYELFGETVFERLPSKKDESVSGIKREMIQQIRKEIKETLKEIREKYFPVPAQRVVAYIQGSRAAVCELIELTLAYKKALDEKKRAENIIDFGDMEHLALSILIRRTKEGYEPTPTALDYRTFFTEILIDEYQDSNLVQEMLLKSISGETAGNYNRFMVGDVKQSIYKFRLARPEIFMEKYDTYETDSGTKQRIDLHKNFRSRKEILDSVNYIFAQIMGKQLGGVAYDEKAALYQGAAYAEGDNKEFETELLLVPKTQEAEETDKKLSDREREAKAVALRIKELMHSLQVTDKESGKLRPVNYGDMVILLRTNTGWDEDFKRVLKEEGIPTHVASKTGYFAAREVQTLLQLLRILDNPRQDIPLFGVMKSCFGNFDDREIAWIKTRGEGKKRLYFYLKEWVQEEAGEEEKGLKEKARAFLEFVDAYRDKAVYMPIHELLQHIIGDTGYLQYVSAMPGGEQRRANVQVLLEKALTFEQTSYYGLFHFIRYIEQLEKYEVDYGEANILDENADVVRIMSIHKSKGLEFPVCFVCGLSKKFNMQDVNGKMIADVDMGIGVDYVDVQHRVQRRTLRKNIIGEKMRLDNLGEELRILYVALTRAREKLIMTGILDKPEKKLMSLQATACRKEKELLYGELTGAGSFLDYVLLALARHPAFETLWKAYDMEIPDRKGDPLYAQDASLNIRLIKETDLLQAQIREQLGAEEAKRQLELSSPLTDTDNELMTYMSEVFSYQYEHSNLADLYTKTTVSELKKAAQEEEKDFSFKLYEEAEVIPYVPKFMEQEEKLGGAGRGSAFHKVMELLDFEREERGVKEQMARLRQEGMLSEAYAEAVSVSAIEAFLTTPLAKRMRAAAKRGTLYREQPFVLGLPAAELKESFPAEELVLIQGIIDVYFEEEGELVVADYKTDRVERAGELTDKYQKQLDYYARALQEITGKNVKEKIIYSFCLGEEILLQ